MELVKDIYFNTDKLVENTKIKVSYTGKFYQGNSDKVFLHYGYGKDWDNVNEIEMKKTDLGYQAELDLMSGDTLNFCFKNQNNEWDNNLGKNYIFEIEKKATTSELRNPNLVFLGKSFGNKTETSSNIYWASDTILPKANNVITGNFGESAESSTPVNSLKDDNCFKIINPTVDANLLNRANESSSNDVIQAVEICSETTNDVADSITENALVVAPTGFNYWTKKIKDTVCKFFSYVPKLISGNYKRSLAKNKEQ